MQRESKTQCKLCCAEVKGRLLQGGWTANSSHSTAEHIDTDSGRGRGGLSWWILALRDCVCLQIRGERENSRRTDRV